VLSRQCIGPWLNIPTTGFSTAAKSAYRMRTAWLWEPASNTIPVSDARRPSTKYSLTIRRTERWHGAVFAVGKQPLEFVFRGEPDLVGIRERGQSLEIHEIRRWKDGFNRLAIGETQARHGSPALVNCCGMASNIADVKRRAHNHHATVSSRRSCFASVLHCCTRRWNIQTFTAETRDHRSRAMPVRPGLLM
jgi:hypothetical protein